MCQCEFNKEYSLKGNEYTVHNFNQNFKYNEKKFNSTKKDNYLTIETFKCVKLPFSKSGFKGNYGSLFMIAIICIVFLSYLMLIISGKYHLLSVLELLYNSNIKSMNYIKNPGYSSPVNYQPQYDARSSNLLLNSQRGVATNGLMMSNILTGNNFISGPNNTYNKVNPINVGKKTNNSKNGGIQIVSKNTLNKNNGKKEKNNLINVDEIQENDYESERNSLGNDKTGINSMNKNKLDLSNKKEEPNKKEESIKNEPKKEEIKKEESENEEEPEEEEISSIDKNKGKDISKNNIEEQNNNNNNNNNKKEDNLQNNNKSKEENKDEEEEESDEDDEDNDSKANPPRKKHGSNKPSKVNGN